jgi:hypothetical protein
MSSSSVNRCRHFAAAPKEALLALALLVSGTAASRADSVLVGMAGTCSLSGSDCDVAQLGQTSDPVSNHSVVGPFAQAGGGAAANSSNVGGFAPSIGGPAGPSSGLSSIAPTPITGQGGTGSALGPVPLITADSNPPGSGPRDSSAGNTSAMSGNASTQVVLPRDPLASDFLNNNEGAVLASDPPNSAFASNVSAAAPAADPPDPPEIPVPAALPLFATGLGVLGWFGRRRQRKIAAAATI